MIEHQPCARVFSFQCGKVMTCSPRLNKWQGNVPTLPLYYLHSCTSGSVALLCFLHKSSIVFHMYSSWKHFPQISESSLRALQDRDWGQWGVNRWNTCRTTCKRAYLLNGLLAHKALYNQTDLVWGVAKKLGYLDNMAAQCAFKVSIGQPSPPAHPVQDAMGKWNLQLMPILYLLELLRCLGLYSRHCRLESKKHTIVNSVPALDVTRMCPYPATCRASCVHSE